MTVRATAWHDPVTRNFNLSVATESAHEDDEWYPADSVNFTSRTLQYDQDRIDEPSRPLASLTEAEAVAVHEALRRALT